MCCCVYVRAEERGRVVYSSLRRSLRAVDADSNEDDGDDRSTAAVKLKMSPLLFFTPATFFARLADRDRKAEERYLSGYLLREDEFDASHGHTCRAASTVFRPSRKGLFRYANIRKQVNECAFSSSWAKPLLFPSRHFRVLSSMGKTFGARSRWFSSSLLAPSFPPLVQVKLGGLFGQSWSSELRGERGATAARCPSETARGMEKREEERSGASQLSWEKD